MCHSACISQSGSVCRGHLPFCCNSPRMCNFFCIRNCFRVCNVHCMLNLPVVGSLLCAGCVDSCGHITLVCVRCDCCISFSHSVHCMGCLCCPHRTFHGFSIEFLLHPGSFHGISQIHSVGGLDLVRQL